MSEYEGIECGGEAPNVMAPRKGNREPINDHFPDSGNMAPEFMSGEKWNAALDVVMNGRAARDESWTAYRNDPGTHIIAVCLGQWKYEIEQASRPAESANMVPMEMLRAVDFASTPHEPLKDADLRTIAARYGYTVTESAKEGK